MKANAHCGEQSLFGLLTAGKQMALSAATYCASQAQEVSLSQLEKSRKFERRARC